MSWVKAKFQLDYTTHFNKRTSYKTNKALKNLFVFKTRKKSGRESFCCT